MDNKKLGTTLKILTDENDSLKNKWSQIDADRKIDILEYMKNISIELTKEIADEQSQIYKKDK